jgi:uracil-DNA glycosylase
MSLITTQTATPIPVKIAPSWQQHLQTEFATPYFADLVYFVKDAYKKKRIYPAASEIFAAFDHCPVDQVKVVILGQDPYHGPKQAHGLCFSVPSGINPPPSLVNIFKEIKMDLGQELTKHGDLTRWAKQGILLLNATLTVAASQAGSHQGKGWETFTDAVIRLINAQCEGVVFLLWGAYAQRKGAIIDATRHYVLKSPHPSPFSADRGFFGCKHFSKTNAYLTQQGKSPVVW